MWMKLNVIKETDSFTIAYVFYFPKQMTAWKYLFRYYVSLTYLTQKYMEFDLVLP